MAEKSEAAFEMLMSGTIDCDVSSKLQQSEGITESMRWVSTRRVQSFFRKAVLGSYKNKCALTGLTSPELLIASHIIPWSEDESRRADPTNGICLNALHDKAFDRNLITFDEDYRLVVSSVLKSKDISEFEHRNFIRLEGVKLCLPHRFLPDPDALSKHRDAFLK